ncbi:MAG: UvrD-helicase domain-containing protein [Pseudomonadota bacterium]
MNVIDAPARAEALDPLSSFCVSAPAGSGKTGLLVQRFLALLARVQAPEQVVAITFTRKAAAEMRNRIIGALKATCAAGEALEDYQRQTHDLASTVARRDEELGWGLLTNPSRLRIQTIDSFCASLARQMPVLSGSGGSVNTTDTADGLYRDAVERFLQGQLRSAESPRADLETLLLHMDNNWELAADLLVSLLARREQWQPVLGGSGLHEDSREVLRNTVEELIQARWERLQGLIGGSWAQLEELLEYQAENLDQGQRFEPGIGGGANGLRQQGVAVAQLLLTKDGAWRRQVTKREGFPAGKGHTAAMKKAVMALIAECSDSGELLSLLREMRRLPDVSTTSQEWGLLAIITRLLPRLAAQLLVVFQQREQVDHSQIAMAANEALGDDDAPTDLALRLDYQLEHLLVDEFQDTSTLQFELIRRLTRGWAEHNALNVIAPRTLFLVGDAMQSIYRFRQANVGLFLKAREHGVGDLPLRTLDLQVNFRSQRALVDWSNETFQTLFPAEDEPSLGAVRFSAASAGRASAGQEGGVKPEIKLFAGEGAKAAELNAICERVHKAQKDTGVESIAILGRSRSQLRPVLIALRERGIDAAAQELDTLEQRQVVRDLFTLTCALLDQDNRYAWLSLLRTPSIGLGNNDLLITALNAPTVRHFVAVNANELTTWDGLSGSAERRLSAVRQWLDWCQAHEERLAPRVFIEEAWLSLGGAASLGTAAEQADAEQFYQCIELMDRDGEAITAKNLRERLTKLFAAPGGLNSKVEVMTLHKAKGLEFDCVLIPALSGGTANQDQQLLQWDEFVLPGGHSTFLLGTRPATGSPKEGTLYDYLQFRAKGRQQLEAVRLLYVGCTRAAKQLWLSGCLNYDENKEQVRPPTSGSLLAHLWPAIQDCATPFLALSADDQDAAVEGTRYRRLRSLPDTARVLEPTVPVAGVRQAVGTDNRNARAWGTALHACLETLAYRETLPAKPDARLDAVMTAAFGEAGVDTGLRDELLKRGRAALATSLSDPWLRYLLSPERGKRHAELPLTLSTDEGAVELVVDYCVVDAKEGVRWIVDYKSSEPVEGQGTEAFLAEELERYQPQLERYAEAVSALYPEPIRCALYFVTTGLRKEWIPAMHAS